MRTQQQEDDAVIGAECVMSVCVVTREIKGDECRFIECVLVFVDYA